MPMLFKWRVSEFCFSAIPDQHFLGGPVIRTLHFHCWAPRYDPWSEDKIPTSCDAQQKNVKPTKMEIIFSLWNFYTSFFHYNCSLALKYSQISLQCWTILTKILLKSYHTFFLKLQWFFNAATGFFLVVARAGATLLSGTSLQWLLLYAEHRL